MLNVVEIDQLNSDSLIQFFIFCFLKDESFEN
nr:MAG TPA: hypothetical protein [Caudoviricetes sp.]